MVRYQPLRNNQFKSLTWGTEVLFSDNRYDVTATGRHPCCPTAMSAPMVCTRISLTGSIGSGRPGLSFSIVQNAQDKHQQTYAYSPYLTWYPSHWNELRLQYTYTQPYGKVFFPGFQ